MKENPVIFHVVTERKREIEEILSETSFIKYGVTVDVLRL